LEQSLKIKYGGVKECKKRHTIGKKFEKLIKSKSKICILVVVARHKPRRGKKTHASTSLARVPYLVVLWLFTFLTLMFYKFL